MNIHLPSNDTHMDWTIFFHDGTTFENTEGPWSDVSDLVPIDEVNVFETQKPVRRVTIRQRPSSVYFLEAPPDRNDIHFFAFQRCAIPTGDQTQAPTWLYSCFGYTLELQRAILIITAYGSSFSIQSCLTSWPMP